MRRTSDIFSLMNSAQRQLRNVLRKARAVRHRGLNDKGCVAVGRDGLVYSLIGEEAPTTARVTLPRLLRIQFARNKIITLALGRCRLSILDFTPAGR